MQFFKSLYWEIKSYFVPQRMFFEVQGECKRCGKCCKNIYSVGIENETDLKWMKFFFPSYKRFYISHRDEFNNIVLACKYIGDDGLCKVYKKRPGVCRRYPASRIRIKAPLPDYCGYTVKEVNFKDFLKES